MAYGMVGAFTPGLTIQMFCLLKASGETANVPARVK